MTTMRILFVFLFLLPVCTGEAQAQFISDSETATVSVPTLVRVPPGADTLQVTYRPGSLLATTDALPMHGRPAITWTPMRHGLATLSVSNGPTQNVAIHPTETASGGIAMLLVAGLILFGGAIRVARELVRPTP